MLIYLSEQKLKIAGASPILRIKIVFEEGIFTAVAGISIRSGISRIGLEPIATTIPNLSISCFI